MQLGMIGLGRMGGSMVRRLLRGGHACVVFDSQPASVTSFAQHGATGTRSLDEFAKNLDTPRVVWLMVPAAVVDTTLDALSPHLQSGDIVVDGGNSHYVDDIRRAKALERPRDSLPGCRRQRRRLGRRSRLLSDDWRRVMRRWPISIRSSRPSRRAFRPRHGHRDATPETAPPRRDICTAVLLARATL